MANWIEDAEYITRAKVAEAKAQKLRYANATLRGHNEKLKREIAKLKEDDELGKFLAIGLRQFERELRGILRDGHVKKKAKTT